MTTQAPEPGDQPTAITLPVFIAAAAVLIIGAFTLIWFAIPGPDTRQVLTAPSGDKFIELGELCNDDDCARVAVLDVVQPDQSHLRTYCPLDRPGNAPLFAGVVAVWAPAEDSVTLQFTSPEGPPELLTIVLAECTRTQ